MIKRSIKRVRTTWRGMSAEDILANYPEVFMACRGNHLWPRRAMWRDLSDTVRERTVVCDRCGYTKIQLQDKDGRQVVPERTRHPKGYLTPGTGLKRGQFVQRRDVLDYEYAKIRGRVLDGSGDTVSVTP